MAVWADFYHPDTLAEVLKARRYFLRLSQPTDSDIFVKAALLHVLHGNRPYALSRNSHPITPFHPSGQSNLQTRCGACTASHSTAVPEPATNQLPPRSLIPRDFRQLAKCHESVDAIITSPPFWGMRFDRPNWLRMWFCGWQAEDFHQTSRAFLERQQTSSLEVYREFFTACRKLLRPGGLMILHLGGSDNTTCSRR